MQRFHSIFPSICAAIAGAVLIGGIASAQNAPTKTTMAQETQREMKASSSAMGMHDMPATVTEVDHKTGLVDVESGSMKLKVHFPAASVADLKKGDKITLHLGFTKQ
jgi:hypothetical protein